LIGEGGGGAYGAGEEFGFLFVDGVDLAFGDDGGVAGVEGGFFIFGGKRGFGA
jgi:hypothetical protein